MGKYTSIGGQALIEGIMMKSPEKTALAVRVPDGSIDVSDFNGKSIREKYKILKLPIIRGIVGFAESMIQGYKAMMISADKSGFTDLEEEADKKKETEENAEPEADSVDDISAEQTADAKPEKKENSALVGVIMVIGSVLGVLLAIALFTYVPIYIADFFGWVFKIKNPDSPIFIVIEQIIKMAIFVGYVALVSLMKDIKRVFMYHGAEHKTIFCYEKGLELNVENVRQQKRFHPRCGTSFMILMITVSILISFVVLLIDPDIRQNKLLWTLIKVLLIPPTCGVGFEVLRFCGKYDNWFTRVISAPGLWLQRITTKEPDDGMIEVAIAALKACEPENPDVDRSIDKIEANGEETDDNI